MKTLKLRPLITQILLLGALAYAQNAQSSDLKSCQSLNCKDTKTYPSKEAQTQCLITKRDCHKRYLDSKIVELKKTGITADQRKKIVSALEKARSKSRATLTALKAKVKITEGDLADIDRKIKQVESLPAKK